MPERAHASEPYDKDYVVQPKAADFMAEDESLRRALESRDFATFSLWLQRGEMEAAGNPVEHAQLLARAARILSAANDARGASELLIRAARLARGADANTEEMIVTLLEQVGGEEALNALAASYARSAEDGRAEKSQSSDAGGASEVSERQAVNERYQDVQRELIVLGSHDWRSQLQMRHEPALTDEEHAARVDALKKELQALVIRRAELMR